mgnify:CR=1 FL=1
MTDTDDSYSENQGAPPPAHDSSPIIDASDSPELKRPHRSRKGRSARRQGRDKSRRGGTRKQAQEIAGKPASPHVESDLEEVVFEAEGKNMDCSRDWLLQDENSYPAHARVLGIS